MVIFDGKLQVATAQTLVGLGSVGSVVPSTDRIDLTHLRDVGDGYEIRMRVDFPTAVSSDATRSIQFLIATTSDTGFTNLVYLAKSGPLVAASMTASSSIEIVVPPALGVRAAYYLFGGIEVTAAGGGDWVAGTCNMRFIINSQSSTSKTYPPSFAYNQ